MSLFGGFNITDPSRVKTQGSGVRTKGRIDNGSYAVNYPSPFFDIAQLYAPQTYRELFRYCRYYAYSNATVNACALKRAQYPVTDIVITDKDKDVKKFWEDLLRNKLDIRSFRIEAGFDYEVMGNAFCTIQYPFDKYLICSNCKSQFKAKNTRNHWKFINGEFRMDCPACGHSAAATPKDVSIKNVGRIKLIRWDAEQIDIAYNEITNESVYFLRIPKATKSAIMGGKKEIVDSIPNIYLQAVRKRKNIIFDPTKVFHFKRATLAGKDRGWGMPMILPILKNLFNLQIMKKANEANLMEHMLPLNILFPQSGQGDADVYTTVNLAKWRDSLAKEIARWRWDKNYIPIAPLPIGSQSIGGQGRSLLLAQEMRLEEELIIQGMGVPQEFIKGGLQYSGTNVSMRMMENEFLSKIKMDERFMNWVVSEISAYLGVPTARVSFKPFKMADDLQNKQYLMALNQAGKISDQTLLAQSDIEQEEEDKILLSESERRMKTVAQQQKLQARIQADIEEENTVRQQALQRKLQEQEEQGAPPGAATPQRQQAEQVDRVDIEPHPQVVNQLVTMVAQAPEDQRGQILEQIKQKDPRLARAVQKQLPNSSTMAQAVDMRPLPEKLPPRRDNTLV